VEDINGTLKKAESLGAKTERAKTEISGGHGFFAIVKDPQGYYLGIWSKA
jgi:predicted enzyme related to lactoylglutathione lyase